MALCQRLGILLVIGMQTLIYASEPKSLPPETILKTAFQNFLIGSKSNFKAKVSMAIRRPNAPLKERVFSLKSMLTTDAQVNYMIKFLSPKEVRGTSFLVRGRKGASPEQFLYLPSRKLVRKLAAGNALKAFFGSDFLFADLIPPADEDASKTKLSRLSNTLLDAKPTVLIQAVPEVEGSPYSKIVFYIDEGSNALKKIDYFDKESKLLKEMKVNIVKKKKNLVSVELNMHNLQTNGATKLKITGINSKAEFSAADFTPQAMKRP